MARADNASGEDERRMDTGSRMIARTLAFVFGLFVCLGLCFPLSARASWPVGETRQVIVGFHETYSTDEGVSTHYGVDIAAQAAVEVSAPVGGTVSFVGCVPSDDDGSKATMTGVSLGLPDGRTLTMMPFASTVVAEGDAVAPGDIIGTLAPFGDRSSSQTHLHVGLKQGRTYFDPLSILGEEGAEQQSSSGDEVAAGMAEPSIVVQSGGASSLSSVVQVGGVSSLSSVPEDDGMDSLPATEAIPDASSLPATEAMPNATVSSAGVTLPDATAGNGEALPTDASDGWHLALIDDIVRLLENPPFSLDAAARALEDVLGDMLPVAPLVAVCLLAARRFPEALKEARSRKDEAVPTGFTSRQDTAYRPLPG